MSGTFGGLGTALSSLYAQRRGLEVCGQNIANANTDGYSRQRLGLASVGAPVKPAVSAVGDPASGGVRITDLTRMRDEFLEARARQEHSSHSFLVAKTEIYAKVEQIIAEPSDTGIQSQMSEFWSAWHSVANRPGDNASRTELLQRGETLATSIANSYESIASLWFSAREQFDARVSEINTTAQTVAQLNEAVVRTRQAGIPGNELADQRDQAVLRLSQLTGGRALLKSDSSVDVIVSGSSLVSGANARQLVTYGSRTLDGQAANPVGVRWADTGLDVSIPSGSLAADYETLSRTLAGVASSLDTVANTLITRVNTQHRAGFDPSGAAGGDFFSGTTASSISMAIKNPSVIAAASSAPVPPATTTLDGDNANAIAMIETSTTGPDYVYRQFIVDLGIQSQSANRRMDIQQVITDDADSSRLSVSGVNLDEEMTDMIMYQRAYEAAAKVISTIDATLDSLIHGLRR